MQSLALPKINAAIDIIPRNFREEISPIADCLEQKTANPRKIQNALAMAISREFPQLIDLSRHIIGYLESAEGFVVVKNLPFLGYRRPLVDCLFLSLMICLGSLTVHDNHQQLLWEVKPNLAERKRELTFSELNTAAPWHTDSAFSEDPEGYFGLFVLKSANQGGDSLVMRADKMISSLEKNELGRKCLEILRCQHFPFLVPAAFRSPGQAKVIYAPIIGNSPLIRFRLDTILAELEENQEWLTADRLWALNYFNNFLESYPDVTRIKLDTGDVIFINNHTMLHGRTEFAGSDRLLLRARVQKYRPFS